MKNQILITLDSLRGDCFKSANCPFLKQFKWDIGYSHADFTLPAHTAIFAGKLPHTFEGTFDWSARSNRKIGGVPHYKLTNPENPSPAKFQLYGKNIIDGFNKLGYNTIGTGAVAWFNKNYPAYIKEINDFKYYKWFGEFTVAQEQIKWSNHQIYESLYKIIHFSYLLILEKHIIPLYKIINKKEQNILMVLTNVLKHKKSRLNI